jgi:hypothetical protein
MQLFLAQTMSFAAHEGTLTKSSRAALNLSGHYHARFANTGKLRGIYRAPINADFRPNLAAIFARLIRAGERYEVHD